MMTSDSGSWLPYMGIGGAVACCLAFEVLGGAVLLGELRLRLDELTEGCVLERTQYDEIPPCVEYTLTEDGQELGELLAPLVRWTESQ